MSSEAVLSSALHRTDSGKISVGNILCICFVGFYFSMVFW